MIQVLTPDATSARWPIRPGWRRTIVSSPVRLGTRRAPDLVREPLPDLQGKTIAYFSAEFALHQSLPIYAGGLGVLAGDHCKEASDLGVPLIGVGFMYPQGYFHQSLTSDGWQQEIYES
jgi:glucan phosphorylase